MNEQEIKKEMSQREQQDSFTMGSAMKGGSLKVYMDLSDVDKAQEKIDNFFKTKQYLEDKYKVML